MTFKKTVTTCVAICIMAILWVALCGCDDLGAYEDTTEYYDAFGEVVMINGESGQVEEYKVDEYFYNEDSREDFLVDDDGNYYGIEHGKFVYIAIPFEKDIDMDSLALYMQSMDDAAIYMKFYVVNKIPVNFRPIGDGAIVGDQTGDGSSDGDQTEGDQTGDSSSDGDQAEGDQIGDGSSEGDQAEGDQTGDGSSDGDQAEGDQIGDGSSDGDRAEGDQTGDGSSDGDQTEGDQTGDGSSEGESGGNTENENQKYDDPNATESLGEIVIQLEKGKWNSFVLEQFKVNGEKRESIQINEDQYLLIQIMNNSGLRVFNEEKNAFVDPQSGLELKEARITATNLLIRALDIKDGNEEQGGE